MKKEIDKVFQYAEEEDILRESAIVGELEQTLEVKCGTALNRLKKEKKVRGDNNNMFIAFICLIASIILFSFMSEIANPNFIQLLIVIISVVSFFLSIVVVIGYCIYMLTDKFTK